MRILIITTCTGEKAVGHQHALTREDFQKGKTHVAAREKRLAALLRPAEAMYTGQQHLRLMRGVQALRTAPLSNGAPAPSVDLFILSAGYGLIRGDRRIAPYECTFSGMGKRALHEWAAKLRIAGTLRRLLRKPYDLALILLSDTYLTACSWDSDLCPSGPVVLLCSGASAKALSAMPQVRALGLSPAEAQRFRCGLVGLKGEIARRLMELLAADRTALPHIMDPTSDLLDLLEKPAVPQRRANPLVDQVISIPQAWWNRPQKGRLSYFIPEWDDLVDPDFDFLNDKPSCGRSHWSNNVYAHQLYPEPAYDGILVSKLVAEARQDKAERINKLGVHRFFRVPEEFPIMGDCGAFGYIKEEIPPFTTNEILDYYTRLGFNYGVSIDHLIVAETESKRLQRYQLTIQNAEDFLKEHGRRELSWEPIGAVQGWDAESYVQAARHYVQMGYKYIALGGLVRSQTRAILRIVEAVKDVLPAEIQLHLFGLARFGAIREFVRLGVTSIDSASVLRRAWFGSTSNFLTADGWYAAIRIPQAEDCFRARRLVEAGERTARQLLTLEKECLAAIRAYGAQKRSPSSRMLDRLTEYDTLLAGERSGTRERIRRTLEERPWEMCGCAICSRWGVEVAIFRGNNRNRRRGFHNTHVFYRLIGRILAGERIDWIDPSISDGPAEQR